MPYAEKTTFIVDTSVLLNFLKIDKINLLNLLPGNFLITEHVVEEITDNYLEQQQVLYKAIEFQHLTVVAVNELTEIELFYQLIKSGKLGVGECSAIDCAINRNYILVMDDVRACKQAKQMAQNLQLIGTADILQALINYEILAIEEIEHIKNEWRLNHRFYLK